MSRDGDQGSPGGVDPGFVASKLVSAPMLAGHVPRPRLHRLLDGARDRPLTVLAAPAGSGKSELLAAWSASLDPSVTRWLTLDEADNGPGRFWRGVLAACGVEPVPGAPGAAEALEALGRASSAEPCILVVDGAHVLVEPEARAALGLLADHAPSGLHLVLGCRRPAVRLHLHRARDRLVEIDPSELAFTRAEVGALTMAAGLSLDDLDLDRLVERTEGWAAGVRLATLGMARSGDPAAYLAGFDGSDPHVAEHLRREVLDALAPDVRRLLDALAPFEHFDAGLCEAVTGRPDAAVALRDLVDGRDFASECAAHPGTYHLHRMLRDLLRADLRVARPGAVEELHAQAAGWYEQVGDQAAAIGEWTRAGQPHQAARVVDAQFPLLYDSGRRDVIREWSGKGSIASGDDAWALLDHATRLIVGYADAEGLDVLERVEGLLRLEPDEAACVRALALRSLAQLFTGDVADAVDGMGDVARRLRAADPADRDRLAAKLVVRHAHLWAAIGHTWLERFGEARTAIEDYSASTTADPMGDRFRTATLAMVAVYEGRIDEGDRLAGRALDEMSDVGDMHHVSLLALCTQARSRLERNELDVAEGLLERAAAASGTRRWSPPFVAAHLDLASVWFTLGRRDEAAELVARARVGAEPRITPLTRSWIDARQTSLLLRSRSGDAVGLAARRLSTDPPSGLLLAQSLLLRGDVSGAEALLASLPADTPRREVGLALARAQAAWARQRVNEAHSWFEGAVESAGRVGLLRTVVESGPHVGPLLARLPDRAGGYVARLREAARREAAVVSAVRLDGSELSNRELEILGYLPTGLTMREIATELFVSGNTMKTHLAHIYRKLGATSRDDAVARARARGFLD